MPNTNATAYVPDEQEIARLVAEARSSGQPDSFLGKRRWVRYQLGMRLEITNGGTREGDTWPVLMHSISGGGFGVWSKQGLPQDALIFVRQWTEKSPAPWVPARVTHCTVGLQGYLVGARFEHPCPSDLPGESAVMLDALDDAADERPGVATTLRSNLRSARGRAALYSATAVALGAAVMGAAMDANPQGLGLAWTSVALAGACGLAGCAGWALLRREEAFLLALRVAMHRLAKGSSEISLPAEAPSRELDALRRTFQDVAANWRRREEEERSQRQKLEELAQVKSNILSIVSHDLRTPLTSILLYAQMLNEEVGGMPPDDQRRFLQIISDECTRLSRLVDDLLEVQRWEAGRVRWDVKPQDLTGSIRSCARVFEAMAKNKSIEFTVECPETLPPVEADADKISQVLSNLLSNAMKYTPSGGNVHLTAEARGHEVLFRVSDSGPGIPRDKWDQIFDRFSQLGDPNTTQIDGVGLGLYIVKRIVECHGGTAWVDSEMGSGSEFGILLPTKAANVKIKPDAVDDNAPREGRIVVCDPDPELTAMIAQTLRNANFDVRVCHSGRRLLALLGQGGVDVVITDVLLPDMNATEILHSLENLPDRGFTLFVHTYAADQGKLSRKGVDVFLQRPVSREDLLAAVHETMRQRGGTGMTMLVMDGGGVDVTRLTRLLSAAGHRAIVVDSMKAAASQIRKHENARLLVSAGVLSSDWRELDELTVGTRADTQVIVLCHPLRKRERRLAEDRLATAMDYCPGREEAVARQITARTAAAKET